MSFETTISLRPEWKPDASVTRCDDCKREFSLTLRRHHCRVCGQIFCYECSNIFIELPKGYGYGNKPQRVCRLCEKQINKMKLAEEEETQTIENGVLAAQYYLRDKPFQYISQLKDMGRVKSPLKYFFEIKGANDAREFVMTLVSSSTTLINSDVTRKLFRSILKAIQHPYILPVERVDYILEKNMAVVIRSFSKDGSLRDRLYKANPKQEFAKKYAVGRTPVGLPPKLVAQYGRQILEALSFLKSKRFPYPYLHASNIILKDTNCYLTDLESTLLGLPPLYLQYFEREVEPEVTCFGHVLFQMAMGFALAKSSIHEFAARLPKPIYDILCLIFSSTGTKPTLDQLLRDPFFSSVSIKEDMNEPRLKCELEKRERILLKKVKQNLEQMIQTAQAENSATASGTDTNDTGASNGNLSPTSPGRETKNALATSPPLSPTSPYSSDDENDTKEPNAFLSPREEKAFAEQQYSSPNPNDPLNPENRKNAVRTRRQIQKRKNTLKKKRASVAPIPQSSVSKDPRSKSPPPPAGSSTTLGGSGSINLRLASVSSRHSIASPGPASNVPAAPAPPPPPPAPSVKMPEPQQGRSELLSSIRDPSQGLSRLRKVKK